MEDFLTCLVVMATIYKVIELFVHRRERLTVLDNLIAGTTPDKEQLKELFDTLKGQRITYFRTGRFLTLRIACLAIGVSLGMVINGLLEMNIVTFVKDSYYPSENLGFAFTILFGGLGLLAAYLIERNEEQEDARKEERSYRNAPKDEMAPKDENA